ncbi:hypothetical protein U14_01934 [Candidatus Moduliflexus flocculans]|uniref:Uncharacterized protein n=1 Tax=Candidatus Moduliflexus flocculans TaxID=1499966 RepID=A0A0S6VT61_9BACT|nr:hypothetical protein U14_01934 [Candidatus Moduliflexus flocculans]
MAKTTIIFIALFILSTTAGIVNHLSYRSSLKSWKQAVASRDNTVANLNTQVATLKADREGLDGEYDVFAKDIAALKSKVTDCQNRLALYQDDRPITTGQQPKIEKPRGLGVSYKQATQKLAASFAIKQSTPVNGQPRYMGMSHNQLATIEIIGDQQNISKASLLLGVPNDDSQALQQNALFALQFVQNVVPEWGWPENEKWIAESIQNLSGEEQGERSITKAGKVVKMSWLSSIAVFSLSISRE